MIELKKGFSNPKERIDRTKNTTDNRESDLQAYEKFCGFNHNDYIGKLILDIGSSFREKFSQEAKEKGIKVVSMNPELCQKSFKYINIPKKEREEGLHAVSAMVQNMPFKDDTFDGAVSLYAIPEHLVPKADEYINSFNETIRVLKPGGKVSFYPIFKETIENSVFKDVLNGLENSDFTVEKVEDRYFRLTLTKRLSETNS